MTAVLDPIAIALGAGLGGILRFVLTTRSDGRTWLGLGVANVLGSLLVGVASGLGLGGTSWALVGIGFCGGLTTWSALSVHSVDLGWRRGTALSLVTVGLAVAACLAGHGFGALLVQGAQA